MQADARCPSSKKQQRQRHQRQRRLKQRLNIKPTNLALENLDAISLFILSAEKEILKIGRRKVHVPSNKQNVAISCC